MDSAHLETERAEIYEVEAIKYDKQIRGNGTYYFIKWKGYDDTDNTWEPTSHLPDAKEMAPLTVGPEMPAAELLEAQKYLETGFDVTFVSGKDILDFWRMHEKEYPYLAKMARQYLGCPVSSASVERIFSVAGQFFDDVRRKLDDKKLEELMWAAINKDKRRKE